MPLYDFRCRSCGDTFEVSRPMVSSGDPAPCPAGHDDTVKLMTIGAVVGAGTADSAVGPASGRSGSGGGCCGGGCCS